MNKVETTIISLIAFGVFYVLETIIICLIR